MRKELIVLNILIHCQICTHLKKRVVAVEKLAA
jgi:hypothetical protein